MSYSRSEVVMSTDPARLARSPEDVRLLLRDTVNPGFFTPEEEQVLLSPEGRAVFADRLRRMQAQTEREILSSAVPEEVIPSSPAPTDQTRVVGVGLVDRAEMERRRNARLKAARNVHRIYGADR